MTLPGEPCQIEPQPTWTDQEKWVWKQVCEGRIANFNKGEDYGGNLDPKTPEGWPESRGLRPAFLETILLHEPYRSAVPRQGVRIIGAWFGESLDLSNATIPHQLWLDRCRFEASVNFNTLRTRSLISLEGSKFTGTLDMNGLQVKNDLLMRGGAEFADVVLRGAKVGDQLNMIGSKFTGTLDMNGLQVKNDLLMSGGAEFAEVVLRGAKVGTQLDMSGSKFKGTLNMEGLQVGQNLLMGNSEVASDVEMSLPYAEIHDNFDISGSKLTILILEGTKIHGVFRLGSPELPSVKWQKGAILKLRNTAVGTFHDRLDAWPDKLDLVGFTYTSLGSEIASRDVSWFTKWLAKQREYSPQPYEQLAGVLRKAGHRRKANDVLYAGKERELSKAQGWQWAWLTALKVFIGYGFRTYYTLPWVLAFTAAGVLVLTVTKQGPINGMPYGISYSLDMLLPIIELSKLHYDKIHLDGFARYYFYFHKIMGWILASFLVAGITGLTKD